MLSADTKRMFPLSNLDDVLMLFRKQIQQPEPNLTLLSLVAGYLETSLISRFADNNAGDNANSTFPVVEWDLIDALYKKFQGIVSVIDTAAPVGTTKKEAKKQQLPTGPATRDLIKRVSDLIWNSLIRSTYKDRGHLQSLYSYLTLNKLDCFGVAFAVVAACQMLGYSGVNLAISEDHAWVVFGAGNRRETIEVTWHGKGFEDKRGESVDLGVDSQSWLYLCGRPVVCDRFMEVAALVLAINPTLNLSSACEEVTELQRGLLWLLYDHGHLKKYPMGLGNLGELEEWAASSSPAEGKRPTAEDLYRQAVKAGRTWYNNYHVYPSVYQGSYYYRKTLYRAAFEAWADAGDAIRRYVYSRDDEEIYKELLDIANEQIPSIMKTEGSGHSARSILRDPKCFANLLRFYDGICKWEEGSLTPILHIGWAKPFGSTIGKFDYDIRSQVIITTAGDYEQVPEYKEEGQENEGRDGATTEVPDEANNNAAMVGLPPSLAALTAACGEKLLNPNYLTGGEVQPFKTEEKQEAHKEVQPPGEEEEPKRPTIKLYSQKMKGLKDLLMAEKLNTQAMLLQMTAQSASKKASRGSNALNDCANESVGSPGGPSGSKRSRRE